MIQLDSCYLSCLEGGPCDTTSPQMDSARGGDQLWIREESRHKLTYSGRSAFHEGGLSPLIGQVLPLAPDYDWSRRLSFGHATAEGGCALHPAIPTVPVSPFPAILLTPLVVQRAPATFLHPTTIWTHFRLTPQVRCLTVKG